jgi:diguanylate cyclase (GGDEF)-like protein
MKYNLEKGFIAHIDQNGVIESVIQNSLFDLKEGELLSCPLGDEDTCQTMLELISKGHKPYHVISWYDHVYLFSGYKRTTGYQITILEIEKTCSHLLQENQQLKKELDDTKTQLEDVKIALYDNLETLGEYVVKDPLTQVYNRTYLNSKFQEVLAMMKRLKHAVVFVYLDLNYFKLVNATFGYDEGDRLLKKFSEISLQMTRRDFDYVFRVGGDDFVILMVECDEQAADMVCDRLNEAFKKNTVVSSVSYGIYRIDDPNVTLAHCLEASEKLMLSYKEAYTKNEHFGEVN